MGQKVPRTVQLKTSGTSSVVVASCLTYHIVILILRIRARTGQASHSCELDIRSRNSRHRVVKLQPNGSLFIQRLLRLLPSHCPGSRENDESLLRGGIKTKTALTLLQSLILSYSFVASGNRRYTFFAIKPMSSERDRYPNTYGVRLTKCCCGLLFSISVHASWSSDSPRRCLSLCLLGAWLRIAELFPKTRQKPSLHLAQQFYLLLNINRFHLKLVVIYTTFPFSSDGIV